MDECFAGIAMAYYATGDVANMTFTVDLSALSLFNDAAQSPVARVWDGSQWLALATQQVVGRQLMFVSPHPQQVTVFSKRVNATVQAQELSKLLPKAAEGEASSVVSDDFSNAIAEVNLLHLPSHVGIPLLTREIGTRLFPGDCCLDHRGR